MNQSRVKSIRIEHLDFLELTRGNTGNIIAESEVPDMLKNAFRAGAQVILTDPNGKDACQLILADSGQFQYEQLP